ncbi:MAG: NPCBM/NEW2 domain-containing protein [Candidatus Hydrogenedentes bacterium]|nr:NPCBM/NEW2 domain-containing protein [Candidatus Hydrogenedentota bacterium]
MSIVHEDGPGDTKVGRCAAGGPLRLGDAVYEHGIGVNSHSVLRVSLERPAKAFLAEIGLDRNVDGTPASVRFHVVVQGRDAFVSDVVRPGAPAMPIDVPLEGARSFDLVVDTGGDTRAFDQGDWADARVAFEDGTTVWLDELPVDAGSSELPFSFVYGGRHSAELLPDWPAELAEEAVDATTRRRTLTFTDPDTGLEVKAVCFIYTDTPGVDWTLHFTNTGTAGTAPIEQIRSLDVTVGAIPPAPPPILHSLLGSTAQATDWLPTAQPLDAGRRVAFAPQSGRSSKGASPFFAVAWEGGGVATAVGWTGRWTAAVEHGSGAVRLEAGLERAHIRLRPGESIRGPRILQVRWAGGDVWRGHNLFRRVMLAHILPKLDGRPVTPPIAHLSTSFYELDRGTEADVLSHLESIDGLGFEYFWLDAYRGRDPFPTVGHYVLPIEREVDMKRFPRGLKPIGDAAHGAGLKFLLWFEPERICPGTLMHREHPDWVVIPPPDRMGHGGMLNLAIPEARAYVTEYLIQAVREYGIDCLRIDNAVDYGVMWEIIDGAEPDRVGMAEIRYVEGLYRMWDEIRAANPGLFIDNCASGGQRIDLETCARSIPLWRTDATIHPLMQHDFDEAALYNQVITAGLSRYLPFHTSGQSGVTPYQFRSGFNGGIAFCEDCRGQGYPRDMLAAGIAEGKRIRKYFSGDFYALSEVTTSPRDWCVLQYHRADADDGMVLAFRRHRSPYTGYACALRGIDAAADYEVTYAHDYAPAAPVRMPGAELAELNATIEACPGSLLLEYCRVK